VWDVLGEVSWVVLSVMLGNIFSDRVQSLAEVLGSFYDRRHAERAKRRALQSLERQGYRVTIEPAA
jgi:uncharacterized metal-binding protein